MLKQWNIKPYGGTRAITECLMSCKRTKRESQKALVGRRIAQKLRNQSMTIDIHPQSMEEARETLYNCSVRDQKAIRNGC